MKKIGSIFALSALLFAGVAAAQDDTNAVYSANAVGVVRYSIPPEGGLVCVTLPLNPMTGSSLSWPWASSTLATQLPEGSAAYFWDGISWQKSGKTRKGWSGVGATTNVAPGEAIFIKSPTNAASAQTITLLGEVPTDDSLSVALRGSGNLDTRGVTPYPVEVVFATSELAAGLKENSAVYFWDGESWQKSFKTRKGWSGVGATWTNKVGEGVFVQSVDTTPTAITVERPFEW